VHSVSQWPNLRHLGESLGGAEGLLEAVSFKKVTKGMGTGRVANTVTVFVCDLIGVNRNWQPARYGNDGRRNFQGRSSQ